jgi:GT2 family glycosyltransferase
MVITNLQIASEGAMNRSKKVLVVIVTYNSQKFITWAIEPLRDNDICSIRIVDSGSSDISYLEQIKKTSNVEVILESNLGFAAANNRALHDIDDFEYVLFLNPDARIEREQLVELIKRADEPGNHDVGMFSVALEKYSIDERKPLSYYDSLGIYCDALGRWKDIQRSCSESHSSIIQYEAICGAFMLCRTAALKKLPDSQGNFGFEESYYMYKEDIELSLRIQSQWRIKIFHDLHAYHCRGWGTDRKKNPFWARKCSARNDVRLAMSYKWRALPYALLKYLYVMTLERSNG